MFLISPRRYGKSSLVRQALAQLARKRILTLELTVSSFSSYVAFLEGYARALLALETKAEKARGWLRELFPASGPTCGSRPARPAPPLAVSFPAVRTPRDASRLAEEVFALPGLLAERLRRQIVIALDEFQAVTAFDNGQVEHALRAAVQQQRQVGYVFAGSEPSLMEQMVGMKRPFYKAGPVMRLERIPADEFAAFLEARFAATGLKPEAGLGDAIVDLAGNLPYDVQRLAHETWDRARHAEAPQRRPRGSARDAAPPARRAADAVRGDLAAAHARPARGAARRGRSSRACELLATETRHRHRLGGASSVQTALAALMRQDLVAREPDGRYVVVDSLMREWVARRTY